MLRPTNIVLALLTLAVSTTGARAQEDLDKYIAESAQRLKGLVAKSNKDGFRVALNSGIFAGGWLKQSQTNWVTMYNAKLQVGKTYRFIAAGDADVTDLDLRILDPQGKTVASDSTTLPDSQVDFRPLVEQTYTVQVRLYASKDNQPCACLTIEMQK